MAKAARTAKQKKREVRAKLLFFLINLLLFSTYRARNGTVTL